MKYQNIKQQYSRYKAFLALNESKYYLVDKITSEGLTDPHNGISVGTLDKIYKQASLFYINYNLVQALCEQMEDLGMNKTIQSN